MQVSSSFTSFLSCSSWRKASSALPTVASAPSRFAHNKHFKKHGKSPIAGMTAEERTRLKKAMKEGRMEDFFLQMANKSSSAEDKGGTSEFNSPHTSKYIIEGIKSLDQGNPKKAVEDLKVALKHQPDSAEANCVIGYAYTNLREMSLARQHFQRALKTREKYPDAHHGLGSLYLAEGNKIEAKHMFGLALEDDPKHAPTLTTFGNLLQSEGQLQKAIHFYEQAIEADPKKAEIPTASLGEAYAQMGNYVEAVESLKRCVRDAPLYGPAHLSLAVIFIELRRYREAEEHVGKVREILNSPERYVLQTGRSLRDRNRGFVRFILTKGQESVKSHRFDDTLRLGELAVLADPSDLSGQHLLAGAYVQLGKMDYAEDRYKIILNAAPDNFDALAALASVYAKAGRQAEAMDVIMKLQNLHPERTKHLFEKHE